MIFQTTDSPQVFLLDHDAKGEQIKRWITTAEAMDRFQFDWAKIKRWGRTARRPRPAGRAGYQLALTSRRPYSRTGTGQWVEHGRQRAGN